MAARVDLNGIKTAIRDTLLAANTTTASPIDLSSNLSNSKRVTNVIKVNPEMILPESVFHLLILTPYHSPNTIFLLPVNYQGM